MRACALLRAIGSVSAAQTEREIEKQKELKNAHRRLGNYAKSQFLL